MPPIPDRRLWDAAKYAIRVLVARWQRARAVHALHAAITRDITMLDDVLVDLGANARADHLEHPALAEENRLLDEVEVRRSACAKTASDVTQKKLDEETTYERVRSGQKHRIGEREHDVGAAAKQLAELETQQRTLRDGRRQLDRRMRELLRSTERREAQAARGPMGDRRTALRASADDLRAEAARAGQQREDADRRLGDLSNLIADAATRHHAARVELAAVRRDADNVGEGHRHRMAELDAEQARCARELTSCEREINRRLLALGTIVNLTRIQGPELGPLYLRADELRNLIHAHQGEVDRLVAERDAYDRGSVLRGVAAVSGAIVVAAAAVGAVLALT